MKQLKLRKSILTSLLGLVVFVSPVFAQDGDDSKGADAIESGRELVNMDFPELTDIRDIIKAVSLWTGKNVILDRQVHGKVQIISPKQVTKEEAYQAFLSALNVLQLTPVETGKIIKILPIRAALKDNLKTYMGSQFTPRTDEVITQIIPLRYIDAKQIRSTLSRIASSNAIIAYEPTNTLIISESGFKVQRILDIIQLLDVQTQQSQVAIVPIKFADAKSISDKVRQIFTGGGKKGSSYHTYKIMADERTNAVIIFGPPRTIKDVRNLVKKFDTKIDDPSRQASIHVRPLDYADAKKLASTLSALTSSSKNRSRLRATSIRASANKKGGASAAPSVADLGDGVKISADESSNSLLVTGSRAAYDAVNAIVRKMDVKKSQVFIETDVLDIGLNNDLSFGTNIFAGVNAPFDNVAAWEAGGMAPLVIGSAQGDDNQLVNAGDVAKTFANEFTFGVLAGDSVNVPGIGDITPGGIIKMLKSDSNTRVLSSPHILISNNEEGLFSSGKKIFFPTTKVNETTGTSTPTVEKEEVKLQLKIKPNISYSDYVTMTIELDADSLAGTDPKTGLPVISKRKTTQTVTVKNGQTVVISGLVETTEAESFRKIPLLGDIPILGWLFRNSTIKKQKSNLVIFVTPHIVHGPQDLAEIYRDKIKERDELLKAWGDDLEDDDFYAALPSYEDGQFKPTEIDLIEAQRMMDMRKRIYRDMGYDIDDETLEDKFGDARYQETTLTVPVSPSSGGESSSPRPDVLDSAPTPSLEPETNALPPESEVQK
jgi:general secretion pathway protein D